MIKFDLCLNCDCLLTIQNKSNYIKGVKNIELFCKKGYKKIGLINKNAIVLSNPPEECGYFLEHITFGKTIDCLNTYEREMNDREDN